MCFKPKATSREFNMTADEDFEDDDQFTEGDVETARVLFDHLNQLLVLSWRQKSCARSQLKLAIEDTLDTGLPRAYDKPLYEPKCSALFEHVFESYPERDAGVYVAADRIPDLANP